MFALSIGVKLGGDADEGLAGRSAIHPERRYGDLGGYSGNRPFADPRHNGPGRRGHQPLRTRFMQRESRVISRPRFWCTSLGMCNRSCRLGRGSEAVDFWDLVLIDLLQGMVRRLVPEAQRISICRRDHLVLVAHDVAINANYFIASEAMDGGEGRTCP
jgi:hypothetical protein